MADRVSGRGKGRGSTWQTLILKELERKLGVSNSPRASYHQSTQLPEVRNIFCSIQQTHVSRLQRSQHGHLMNMASSAASYPCIPAPNARARLSYITAVWSDASCVRPGLTDWNVCARALRSHWWKTIGSDGDHTRHPRVHIRASMYTCVYVGMVLTTPN